MSITAYPLTWPEGWPRTRQGMRKFGRFGTKGRNSYSTGNVTVAEAMSRIQHELDAFESGENRYRHRLKDDQTVVSTNLALRLDGLPRSGQSEPDDPGAALYFELDGKRQCIPCDAYTKVAQNLAAIAATLAALRTLERHGSGIMERAFTGFTALTDRNSDSWWAVLGVAPDSDAKLVEAAYRAKRKAAHPDTPGGSSDEFVRVTRAWEEFRERRAA